MLPAVAKGTLMKLQPCSSGASTAAVLSMSVAFPGRDTRSGFDSPVTRIRPASSNVATASCRPKTCASKKASASSAVAFVPGSASRPVVAAVAVRSHRPGIPTAPRATEREEASLAPRDDVEEAVLLQTEWEHGRAKAPRAARQGRGAPGARVARMATRLALAASAKGGASAQRVSVDDSRRVKRLLVRQEH